MKAILCICGCKKSDHIYHSIYGANKGDCKNCSWASEFTDNDGQPNGCCPSFSARNCFVKGCDNLKNGEIFSVACDEHQDCDQYGNKENDVKDNIESPPPTPRLRRR